MHSAYHIRKEGHILRFIQLHLLSYWPRIGDFGLSDSYREPDRHKVELTNKLTFIITCITVAVYFAGLALQVNDMATCNFIMMSICLLYWPVMKAGYLIASRVGLLFILYTMQLYIAIISGSKSGMADLLLTTSMIPMMLFGRKDLKWGVFFIVQCVLFYFLYDMFVIYWDQYAMPLTTQLKTHAIMTPVKVATLLITMYLLLRTMIDSETEYEGRKKVLEKQRNYYFNILDSMPIQVGIYGPDMRHSYLNRKAVARMLDDLSSNGGEEAALDINDAPIDAHRAAQLKRCIERQNIVEEEVEYKDQAGRHHTELQGAIPLYDEQSGQLLEFFCYSLDITERKDAEKKLQETVQALRRYNDELKQFSFVVSHDLKTPLRNISTYLQILQRQVKLDDQGNELIGQAVRSVKHMNSMIQDMFMYASSEQADLKCDHVDVKELISSICSDISAQLEERNAEIRIKGALPQVYMNPTHAQHLFSNMITNAVKYNESAKPQVEIGIDGGGFYVRDNGIGIKPQHQEQIFELFKRLHTQDEYDGTGVGLSLCQKITAIYGGTIQVESEYQIGSTFRFSLPTAIQVGLRA